MPSTPPIILTRPDLQRLEHLLETLADHDPAVQALDDKLVRAQVVEPDALPPGVVSLDSRVHCRDDGSGRDYHLTLVMPARAGAEGQVSVLAPVGMALLGQSVGQHVDWPAPGGKTVRLTLLAVEYQPEAAGDLAL